MSISIARYLICEIGVNAGETGSYGKHFGSSELKCKELARTSRRTNIATSQRRDVGSTNIEVNKQQRHDVSTSRRQHDFCLSIIKSKKGTKIRGGGGRSYEGGH